MQKNLRYNILVNLLDGAYFGLGMGFGSFTTIITIFVAKLTDSAILIGLIPAIHAVGWQLPQLFTANWVSRQRRYKPMVMWLTTLERIPFLGLALIAWFLPGLGISSAIWLVFIMLVFQGVGAGLTANSWQTLIAKIIPTEWRGSFLGAQAAIANIAMSISAVLAGYLLETRSFPHNFSFCFFSTVLFLALSQLSLGLTREKKDGTKIIPDTKQTIWESSRRILRENHSFTWFLASRFLSLMATMAFSFYIIYALRQFNMSMIVSGYMTATLTISSTLANILMGWISDHTGHRSMLLAGAIALTLSPLIAWLSPSLNWFYLVVALAGIANASIWTIGMVMTVDYGNEEERPIYIGLSNTLTAPATIIAPLIGGALADIAGFPVTFITGTICGLSAFLVLLIFVRNPRQGLKEIP